MASGYRSDRADWLYHRGRPDHCPAAFKPAGVCFRCIPQQGGIPVPKSDRNEDHTAGYIERALGCGFSTEPWRSRENPDGKP